jgi:hypothetical protein
MKLPKLTPSIAVIRDPRAEPKTTKYKAVVMTGVIRLCHKVRFHRAISKR